ncbi:MAG: DUF2089 family protein [Gammaproteobacteria bacterium]|nr:DUF2089 family protein [Gammaproteobacteria bacterium]
MGNTLALGSPCPACAQPMHPKVLGCACGVRVEAPISINEFASLSPEQLHLLRIFVKCEGRIRDMEAALGISYPTVKARIRELKDALEIADHGPAEEAPTVDLEDVLSGLESGELSADEAIDRLKK